MSNMKNFLHSHRGKILLSIVLGFGLATIFRRVCKDKSCMEFIGPKDEEIKEQVYSFRDKCYIFKKKPIRCNPEKKTIKFS